MSRIWATPVWNFFHTFAEKIDEKFYEKNSITCYKIIKLICYILPCSYCKRHASTYINKINPHTLKKKEDFRQMLFIFHNSVNKRIRKKLFLKEKLIKYNKNNIMNITTQMCTQLKRFNRPTMFSLSRDSNNLYNIHRIEYTIKQNQQYFSTFKKS